jgi:aldehyde:ferredoxin oxidoreductase
VASPAGTCEGSDVGRASVPWLTEEGEVHFYTGTVLRIDLSTRTSVAEPLNMDYARLYIGGKGLLLRYMWDEVRPGLDPWSPESPLYLVTGPFAGTNVTTSSRLVVGCKSPKTGLFNDSYIGGSFAPEMKFAGYDMIVVTGKAAEPTLVVIRDDAVEFRPARRYWGMKTSEIEAAARRDVDAQAKVLSIGPAGENLVTYSCISTDQYHKAGRAGPGAVMGAKNLKAIAIRGTGRVEVGDAPAFLEDVRRIHREYILTEDNLWAHEEGTPILVDVINGGGALPTRHYSTGSFEGAAKINSESFQKIRVKKRACYQCAIACRNFHAVPGARGEGPEYETIALGGANCGIDDIEALMKFNADCDEYGLDTISTGACIALAMEMTEKGIHDFGLRFGEVDGYARAVPLIAARSGIGADLALGERALATKYGHLELAMEVKDLELPGYDPRGAFGMSVTYATSDRGGCHMRSFPVGQEVVAGTLPPDTLEGKPEWIIRSGAGGQNFFALKFSGIWCDFWAIDVDQIAQLMRHVWERDVSEDELMRTGERIWNLGRLFNLREGVAEDDLPERILSEAHATGPATGRVIGREAFAAALREYYSLRGWDEKGVPGEAKLAELGVDVRLPSPA